MDLEVGELLRGPTAIAFVEPGGDAAAVAKVLRDFARDGHPLVLKGGFLNQAAIGVEDIDVLADLPPREVLLAQFAGALAAPMVMMAGLLQALPRQFAYALNELITKRADSSDAGTADNGRTGAAEGVDVLE